MFQVWLQGRAVGLRLSSLRALDSQGRAHLARYPRDCRRPAGLPASVRGTAAFSGAIRSPLASAPRPPPAIASAGRLPPRPCNEMGPCFWWNSGPCHNGLLCRQAHASPRLSPDGRRAAPAGQALLVPRSSDSTVGTPHPPLPGLLRTPISPASIRDIASPATDPALLDTVTSRLSPGAVIGYMGPLPSSQGPNTSSALATPDALSAALNLEVARGHTAGPSPSPPLTPFRCNPLGARTKPDCPVSIILDLFQPSGRSVRDHIDRASFSLQSITMDPAVAVSSGPGHAAL